MQNLLPHLRPTKSESTVWQGPLHGDVNNTIFAKYYSNAISYNRVLTDHILHYIHTSWIFGIRGNWMKKNMWYMCLKIFIVYLKSNLTRGPVFNLATLSDILYLTWWPYMWYTYWLSLPFCTVRLLPASLRTTSPEQQLSLAPVLQSGMTLRLGLPALRPPVIRKLLKPLILFLSPPNFTFVFAGQKVKSQTSISGNMAPFTPLKNL